MKQKILNQLELKRKNKKQKVQITALLDAETKEQLFAKLNTLGFTFTEFLESSITVFLEEEKK